MSVLIYLPCPTVPPTLLVVYGLVYLVAQLSWYTVVPTVLVVTLVVYARDLLLEVRTPLFPAPY
ncbi:hypothetical protein BJY01DRAFT_206866 [Aspergillus pseudoustus]|uniref:Uncharacterized protein n=1 Tax=Aspergillus pseudoustus TaxID=1810923 RepID=A0ABR4KM33_9EURO